MLSTARVGKVKTKTRQLIRQFQKSLRAESGLAVVKAWAAGRGEGASGPRLLSSVAGLLLGRGARTEGFCSEGERGVSRKTSKGKGEKHLWS